MELPILDASWLRQHQAHVTARVTTDVLCTLPEKVLQFGTGVLLRGLPDYYIDRANKAGIFNGRVVVVKTTDQGDVSDFARQDFLYTHVINGVRDGKLVEESTINCSISRILEAKREWAAILDCAANLAIELVLSNTTERGLVYVEESIFDRVPDSFPGKLLALLYHRFQKLGGSLTSGWTVVPTELIEGNGDVLRQYVLQGAAYNGLDAAFIDWITRANTFCNSLVDRIVPGKLAPEKAAKFFADQGYTDKYLLVSEPYDLWAIEGDVQQLPALSFAACNPGIQITADIALYKELKLRLLNATHILSCGKAVLDGIPTVREGFSDPSFRTWVLALMAEIQESVPMEIDPETLKAYSASVVQRFENPFIDHYWESILLNYTSKMQIRAVPLLYTYIARQNKLPEHITQGFSAYLSLSVPDMEENGSYYKWIKGKRIKLQDTLSAKLYQDLQAAGFESAAHKHLSDIGCWGYALDTLPGFAEQVIAGAVAMQDVQKSLFPTH